MKECAKFYKALDSGYIEKKENGKFGIINGWLDDECNYIEINYCPFCGKKLK